MSTISIIIGAILLIIGLFNLITAFLTIDRIVKTLYELDKPSWEKEGKPKGFLWRAPECTWLSGIIINKLCFVWLFTTPLWAAKNSNFTPLFKKLRRSVLAWNLIMVVLFILVGINVFTNA